MNLISVGLHEPSVQILFAEAETIVGNNMFAPKLYIKFYDKYLYLLDGKADEELEAFILKEPNYKVINLLQNY